MRKRGSVPMVENISAYRVTSGSFFALGILILPVVHRTEQATRRGLGSQLSQYRVAQHVTDSRRRLDGHVISLPEVAEWISMKRRCCPFLSFQLSTSGNQSDWILKLTGPERVKALLQAEFPAAHNSD